MSQRPSVRRRLVDRLGARYGARARGVVAHDARWFESDLDMRAELVRHRRASRAIAEALDDKERTALRARARASMARDERI